MHLVEEMDNIIGLCLGVTPEKKLLRKRQLLVTLQPKTVEAQRSATTPAGPSMWARAAGVPSQSGKCSQLSGKRVGNKNAQGAASWKEDPRIRF